MHWENPKTFHEKLLFLKIKRYNSDPLVKKYADKYKVRDYVTEKGFGDTLNELLAVYDKPEDIDWDSLPNRFAMKLNYACGYNIICNDKNALDKTATINKIKSWMKEKPWLPYAELQYKGVTKK